MSSMLFIFTFFITIATANEPLNVAVSYFANNSNDANLNNLEKGIAEMLITDLSISKDIRLVERERLNDVLKEIDLQKNPYFDSASAAQLGKGLGAGIIVTGSFLVMDDTMRIDARLIDVDSSEVLLAVESNGTKGEFFNVQAQLAKKILSGIGSELTILDQKKIGTNGTKDFGAFTAYSTGLSALDQGDKQGAQKAFEQAKSIDPNFVLADDYLKQVGATANKLLETYENSKNNKLIGIAKIANSKEPLRNCTELYNQFAMEINPLSTEFVATEFTAEQRQRANQFFGVYYQLANKITSEWDSLDTSDYTCSSTLSLLYSGLSQYLSPVIQKSIITKKSIASGEENNPKVQQELNIWREMSQDIELMSIDGQSIAKDEQIVSIYVQLLEQMLTIGMAQSDVMMDQITPMVANQLQELTTFLQSDSTSLKQAVNSQKMEALKGWLQTDESVFLMQTGWGEFLIKFHESSFPNYHHIDGANVTTFTFGFDDEWVKSTITKIEAKWIHQSTFSELPTAENTEAKTFCTPRSWDPLEGCLDICPEQSFGVPSPYVESLNKRCNALVTEGWYTDGQLNAEGYPLQVLADLTSLMEKYRQGIPQDPNQPMTLRYTLNDGSTIEKTIYP